MEVGEKKKNLFVVVVAIMEKNPTHLRVQVEGHEKGKNLVVRM